MGSPDFTAKALYCEIMALEARDPFIAQSYRVAAAEWRQLERRTQDREDVLGRKATNPPPKPDFGP